MRIDENLLEQLRAYVDETIVKMGRPRRLFEAAPERAALLVIDMQDAFCAPWGCLENPATRGIVGQINSLARAARAVGVPIIWIRFVINADQSDAGLWPLFQPASPAGEGRGRPPAELSEAGAETGLWGELDCDPERDYEVLKCRYSAFIHGSSKLEQLLRTLGRDTVIITGVGTNVCCESTARDAMMLDFRVVFVGDANATFDPLFHEMTLMNIRLLCGDVATTEEVLAELCGAAGSPSTGEE